jgi:hypothetical protein
MRSGFRRSKRAAKKKELKYRVNQFHQIIDALEEVADILYEDNPQLESVTEQWVAENAPAVMGRELDSMETIVVASRLWHKLDNNGKV